MLFYKSLKVSSLSAIRVVAWSQRGESRSWQIHEEEGLAYAEAGSGLPWTFSSIYPPNQSLPTMLHYAFTYTSDITGGYPPPPLSDKELT